MESKKCLQNNEKLTFTLRMDVKTQNVVRYLQDTTMLSKTGVVKLALMNLYKQEMIKESQIKKIEN